MGILHTKNAQDSRLNIKTFTDCHRNPLFFERIVMQEDMTIVFDGFPDMRTRENVDDINYIFRKQNMFLTHTQSRAH